MSHSNARSQDLTGTLRSNQYAYNGNGILNTITDPNTNQTGISYSLGTGPVSYLTRVDSVNGDSQWSFNWSGRIGGSATGVTRVYDPNNAWVEYSYDQRDRVVGTLDQVNRTSSTSWDNNGSGCRVDAGGSATTAGDDNQACSSANAAGGVSDNSYQQVGTGTDGTATRLVKTQGPATTGGLRATEKSAYADANAYLPRVGVCRPSPAQRRRSRGPRPRPIASGGRAS